MHATSCALTKLNICIAISIVQRHITRHIHALLVRDFSYGEWMALLASKRFNCFGWHTSASTITLTSWMFIKQSMACNRWRETGILVLLPMLNKHGQITNICCENTWVNSKFWKIIFVTASTVGIRPLRCVKMLSKCFSTSEIKLVMQIAEVEAIVSKLI